MLNHYQKIEQIQLFDDQIYFNCNFLNFVVYSLIYFRLLAILILRQSEVTLAKVFYYRNIGDLKLMHGTLIKILEQIDQFVQYSLTLENQIQINYKNQNYLRISFIMYELLISHNNKIVAQLEYSNVILWDVASLNKIKILEPEKYKSSSSIQFSQDDEMLAISQGSKPFYVYIFDVQGLNTNYKYKLIQEVFTSFMQFLLDSKHLLTVSMEGFIRIWQLDNQEKRCQKQLNFQYYLVEYNEKEELFAFYTKKIYLYHLSAVDFKMKQIGNWKPHKTHIYKAKIISKRFLLTSGDQEIKLWNLQRLNKEMKPIWTYYIGQTLNLQLFQKILYGQNSHFNMWNLQSGKLLKSFVTKNSAPITTTKFAITSNQQIILMGRGEEPLQAITNKLAK